MISPHYNCMLSSSACIYIKVSSCLYLSSGVFLSVITKQHGSSIQLDMRSIPHGGSGYRTLSMMSYTAYPAPERPSLQFQVARRMVAMAPSVPTVRVQDRVGPCRQHSCQAGQHAAILPWRGGGLRSHVSQRNRRGQGGL